MKKITVFICIIAIILSFVGCAKKGDASSILDQLEGNEALTDSDYVSSEEPENRLSDSYTVMCSGTDRKGNFYELVATSESTATSFKIEFGAIKNNEWVMPLTDNVPFLDDDGYIRSDIGNYTIAGAMDKFEYLGGSLFFYDDIIFNCETSTYRDNHNSDHYMNPKYRFEVSPNEYEYVDYDEGYMLVISPTYDLSAFYLMDIETMEVTKIMDYHYPNGGEMSTLPYCNGLFALFGDAELPDGFYDKNGNLVIDLSMYSCTFWVTPFIEDTITFDATNGIGKRFTITMDKTGKVLNEVPYNYDN